MRPTCSSCDRPLRVCLCAQLPPQPIHTTTKVIILQHPHETRQKLATVPIVARCLSNVSVIVGRRLQLGTSRLLDALSTTSLTPSPSPPTEDALPPPVDDSGWRCRSCARRKTVLLLFPTPSATELRTWMKNHTANDAPSSDDSDGSHVVRANCGTSGERSDATELRTWMKNHAANDVPSSDGSHVLKANCGTSGQRSDGDGEERVVGGQHSVESRFRAGCSSNGETEHIILLIFDGTWQHAREMVKASMPFLSGFVEQVCLPHDITREGGGMGEGDSNSIVRKEPFAGCVSTMEAIARALGMLELNGNHIEQTLLSVLRQMVHLQATHFAPMKPRPRLRKERPVVSQTSHPA